MLMLPNKLLFFMGQNATVKWILSHLLNRNAITFTTLVLANIRTTNFCDVTYNETSDANKVTCSVFCAKCK